MDDFLSTLSSMTCCGRRPRSRVWVAAVGKGRSSADGSTHVERQAVERRKPRQGNNRQHDDQTARARFMLRGARGARREVGTEGKLAARPRSRGDCNWRKSTESVTSMTSNRPARSAISPSDDRRRERRLSRDHCRRER